MFYILCITTLKPILILFLQIKKLCSWDDYYHYHNLMIWFQKWNVRFIERKKDIVGSFEMHVIKWGWKVYWFRNYERIEDKFKLNHYDFPYFMFMGY